MRLLNTMILCFLATVISCGCIAYPSQIDDLLFELPSLSENDEVIRYPHYVISFNETTMVANWVAYELTSEETYGTGNRKGMEFIEDLNNNVKQANNLDYKGSGWRKGHLAPAADFKTDNSTMLETFFYTNCAPQADRFNNSQWNELENRVRGWARYYGSIFVVTGPFIGENINGKIGNNQIVVPDAYFKALCVLKDEEYHSIAFLMPNRNDCPPYRNCTLTIDELESITGINFYPSLTEEEKTIDYSFWNLDSVSVDSN